MCMLWVLWILAVQGVVTAAVSLIHMLAMKYPDDYKGSVSLSVSRLSRVCTLYLISCDCLWWGWQDGVQCNNRQLPCNYFISLESRDCVASRQSSDSFLCLDLDVVTLWCLDLGLGPDEADDDECDVHSYQDQFIQRSWAECVLSSLGLYYVCLYCFWFVCMSPFFYVSLSSWVISLTVFGASITNLNEPPRASAASTIVWVSC